MGRGRTEAQCLSQHDGGGVSRPEEIFACACARVCVHVTTSLQNLSVALMGKVSFCLLKDREK